MIDLTKRDQKKWWVFMNKITRPIYLDRSSKCFFIMYIVIALILTCITIWMFLVQYFTSYDQFRYDSECSYENTSGSICHLRIQVTENYPVNSLIYLGIKNYRQSFPRLVKSISDDQLAGKDNASLEQCGVFKTNLKMQTFYSAETESILQPTADSIPCGLMVKNFPRDYFEFEK